MPALALAPGPQTESWRSVHGWRKAVVFLSVLAAGRPKGTVSPG